MRTTATAGRNLTTKPTAVLRVALDDVPQLEFPLGVEMTQRDADDYLDAVEDALYAASVVTTAERTRSQVNLNRTPVNRSMVASIAQVAMSGAELQLTIIFSEVMSYLLQLEAEGLVERAGFRNGQIVWRAIGLNGTSGLGVSSERPLA